MRPGSSVRKQWHFQGASMLVLAALQLAALHFQFSEQALFSPALGGAGEGAMSSTGESETRASRADGLPAFKTSFISAGFDSPLLRRAGASSLLFTSPLANLDHGSSIGSGGSGGSSGNSASSMHELADHFEGEPQLSSGPYDDRRLSAPISSGQPDELLAVASQPTESNAGQNQTQKQVVSTTVAPSSEPTISRRPEPSTTGSTTVATVAATTTTGSPTTSSTTTPSPAPSSTAATSTTLTSSTSTTTSTTSTTTTTTTQRPAEQKMTTIDVNSSSSKASEQVAATSEPSSTRTPPIFESREARLLNSTANAAKVKQQLDNSTEARAEWRNDISSGAQSQVPVCQRGVCTNFVVASVPVLNSANATANQTTVNEFVFMPADLGPLTFEESAYPINKTNTSTVANDSSHLAAEHRTLDGESDLVLPPADGAKLEPSQTHNASSASFMLVNDNSEVELDYANMETADEPAEVQDRMMPASASASTSTSSTTTTTPRPTTTTTTTTTTSAKPAISSTTKAAIQQLGSRSTASLTLNELRNARQKSTTTSTTTTSSTRRPDGQKTVVPTAQATRKNDKFLQAQRMSEATTLSQPLKPTTQSSATTTTTTTTSTARPKLDNSRMVTSRRPAKVRAQNHRQFYNEPAGDWQRRRQPAKETFSPVNNGADEEEASILKRYSIPSQLSRLSVWQSSKPQSGSSASSRRGSSESIWLSPSATGSVPSSSVTSSKPVVPSTTEPTSTSTSRHSRQSTSTSTSTAIPSAFKLEPTAPTRVQSSPIRVTLKGPAEEEQPLARPADSLITMLSEQEEREEQQSLASRLAKQTDGQLLMTLISSSLDEAKRQADKSASFVSSQQPSMATTSKAATATTTTTTSTTTTTTTTPRPVVATSSRTTTHTNEDQTRTLLDETLALALNETSPEEDQLARVLLEDDQQQQARSTKLSNTYGSTRPRELGKSEFDQTGRWQPDTNVDYNPAPTTSADYQPLAINLLPGRPGVDYPIHWQVPKTSFDCRNYEQSGFYADVESDCQAYHSCHRGRGGRHTFLCPNGTLFSQELLTCDWWYNVECAASKLYMVDGASTPTPPLSAANNAVYSLTAASESYRRS